MKRGKCGIDGCGRSHKARGYCGTHYAQFLRGSEITKEIVSRVKNKPNCCSEKDCAEPVKAKGLCKKHYQRLLRHGFVKETKRIKNRKPCVIDGCIGEVYALNKCHAHYMKERVYRKFSMTESDYISMYKSQNGVCKICGKPESATSGRSTKVKDLAIDHDHKTGKVRGLLCSKCNRALGFFNDDPNILKRAIGYLAI